MVKHIILWTLKDSLSEEEKIQIKKSIKEGLESLQGVVPGLTDIFKCRPHVGLHIGIRRSAQRLCCPPGTCRHCKQQSTAFYRNKVLSGLHDIA